MIPAQDCRRGETDLAPRAPTPARRSVTVYPVRASRSQSPGCTGKKFVRALWIRLAAGRELLLDCFHIL